MSDHLSLPIGLPDEDADKFERLETLTRGIATHVLKDHWTPAHLDGIADSSHQAWKYFDEHEPFEEFDLYLPSRFRRCISQKVGETLRSHADRRNAVQSIQTVLPDRKIRRIHRRRIKEQLWDDGDYLSSGYVDILIDNSTATTTATVRIRTHISRCKAVQSMTAVCSRSLLTTAQPAGKPSNTSTTATARR